MRDASRTSNSRMNQSARLSILALLFALGTILTIYIAGLGRNNSVSGDTRLFQLHALKNLPPMSTTPWEEALSRYVDRHTSVSKSKLPTSPFKTVKVKILNAGLGNRYPAIACGLLLAMLSEDRIMMIDYPDELAPRFKLAEDWNKHRHLFNGSKETRIRADSMFDGTLKDIFGSSNNDVATLASFDYDCPRLQVNPNFKETLREWFPDMNMFHKLITALVESPLEIAAKVDPFVKERFRRYTIGVHLRLLKKITKGHVSTDWFCKLAYSLAIKSGLQFSDIVVFIAADTKRGHEELSKCLAGRNLSSISYDNDMTRRDLRNSNPGNAENALLDLYTLSKCSDLIITYSSSYGTVAAGIGDLFPYYVMPDRNISGYGSDVSYWKAMTSEPCMYRSREIVTGKNRNYRDALMLHPLYLDMTQCHFFTKR